MDLIGPAVLASFRTTLIWRGVLAVLIGLVAVLWPGPTVSAFVILFAVHALLLAAADVRGALRADSTVGRVAHGLLAVVSGAAGVAALVWPGATAVVIAVLVAAWAVVTGLVELLLALRPHASAVERSVWMIAGLVSLALGVTLLGRPELGALALATAYGLFSLFQGVTAVVFAVRLRHVEAGLTRLVIG